MNEELARRLARAKHFLGEARKLVPENDDTEVGVRHYADYVKVNELELAADALATLEDIGSFEATPAFWRALRDAAESVGNDERAREYAARAAESN